MTQARLVEWLDEALAFWAEHGVDRDGGGFVEQLALDGSNPGVPFKRTRVMARQIYVFSHAALAGRPGALDVARHGHDFLVRHGWLGPTRGWARLIGRTGGALDETPDLYDLAFVLFALGWYERATGEGSAGRLAAATLEFIHARMADGAGAFLSEAGGTGARHQNPHMHLIEACLIHMENGRGGLFADTVTAILTLLRRRLIDPDHGRLVEAFGPDWAPLPPAERVVEPGHEFEWAWILHRAARLTGEPLAGLALSLADRAERDGVDPATGLVVNRLRIDGRVSDGGSRIWPNTERIKAAVARFHLTGADPRPVTAAAGRVLLERFLAHQPRGTWMDAVDAAGRPASDKIPASSLYHLMLAIREADDAMRALPRAPA